jgi:hypothetical protein
MCQLASQKGHGSVNGVFTILALLRVNNHNPWLQQREC